MSGTVKMEAWKFMVYLVVPVGTVAFFNTPEAIKALIERKKYIVYPPEESRPRKGGLEGIRAQLLEEYNIDIPKKPKQQS